MKKAIAILVLVVVICALSQGCLEKEVPLGQTVVLDDMALTVVKFEERDTFTRPYGNETPPEGATFLFVYVKAKNVGEAAQRVPCWFGIDLQYKGKEDPPESVQVTYDFSKEIYPSVTEEGWIYFVVPKAFDPSEAKIRVESMESSFFRISGHKAAIWRLA